MHILFQKAAYTDTTGLPLAFSESKKKVTKYVHRVFPQYKYHKDQDLWDNPHDNLILLVRHVEELVNLDAPWFAIQNLNNESLYWSCALGWVEEKDCQHFSQDEQRKFPLPDGSRWVQLV